MGWLDGKTALVTGGSSGIGLAVVERFVAEGARVGVMGRTEARLTAVSQALGDSIVTIQGDVTRFEDNARAVAATVDRFGQLDIFVGNAGVFDNFVKLRDIPTHALDAAFDELFGVNVKGYLLGARAALTELGKTGGCMVFTASTSSVQPGFGGTLYVPSKHAVIGLTRQLAFELAPAIRVNAVAIGFVPTELTGLTSLAQVKGTGDPAAVVQRIPLKFVPEPADIAASYVLLASDRQAKFTTGSVILADGGQTMWGPPH